MAIELYHILHKSVYRSCDIGILAKGKSNEHERGKKKKQFNTRGSSSIPSLHVINNLLRFMTLL